MILVTGATGNVGGELMRQLAAANQSVRGLVRKSEGHVLPPGVEAAGGDLNDVKSLSRALNGVRGVFLLGGYADMPGLLAEIRRAGVEHVVLLSSRSVEGGNPTNAVVGMWIDSETAVRAAGVPWTILRPSGFMSNALRWLPQMRTGNTVRVAFADVPIAAIDPADIAAVAAVALMSGTHKWSNLSLSGPQAIMPADQLRVLSSVLRRDLVCERQSDYEARQELSTTFPPSVVDAFFRFFVDGEFDDSPAVPTVLEITGRQPRTFEQWAEAHASAFRAAVG